VQRLPRHFGCPTEFTLQLLGGKWKTVILCYLKEGPLRYGELRAFLPRLSDKVLTERLKELQQSGLISRSAAPSSNAARYRLSERGEALRSVLAAIYHWGDRHAAEFGVECDNPLRAARKPGNTAR
jgi:DNA-binding HxlR family transcriptional regulator